MKKGGAGRVFAADFIGERRTAACPAGAWDGRALERRGRIERRGGPLRPRMEASDKEGGGGAGADRAAA